MHDKLLPWHGPIETNHVRPSSVNKDVGIPPHVREAMLRDDVDVVQEYAAENSHLHQKLLHFASKCGRVKMVQAILEHHPFPDSRDRYGASALHRAIQKQRWSVCVTLVDYDASVTVQEVECALRVLSSSADASAVLPLFLRQIPQVDDLLVTALQNDVPEVALIVSRLCSSRTSNVWLALQHSRVDVLEVLLPKLSKSEVMPASFLGLAILQDNTEAVELLLQYGTARSLLKEPELCEIVLQKTSLNVLFRILRQVPCVLNQLR